MKMRRFIFFLVFIMILSTVWGCAGDNVKPIVSEIISDPSIQQDESTQTVKTPTPTTEEVRTEFYVSPSGNDTNPGTVEKPWKTFTKAVSEVNHGDTVYVMEGVYTERLIINKSGIAESHITFMANPGDTVTIDGEGIKMEAWAGLIDIALQSYIRISGFKVINSPAMGILAYDGHQLIIDNNYVFNTFAPGIQVWNATDVVIDGNILEKTLTEENGPLECLSLRNIDDFQISNNIVFDSGAIGIDMGEGCVHGKIFNNETHDVGVGIYLDAWDKHAYDMEVYNNLSYNNQTGLAVNSENGGVIEDIRVYNNIVYDNQANGFVVGWGGVFEASHTVKNVTFFGNRSSGNDADGFVIWGVANGSVDGIRIVNNLSYDNKRAGIFVSGVAEAPLIYSISNIEIINNTIYRNGRDELWGGGGIFLSNPTTETGVMENITIRNNIINDNSFFTIGIWPFGTAPVNVVIDHNLFDGYLYNSNNYGETRGDEFFEGSPSFIDTENGDFHLSSDSLAIDNASEQDAPSDDFDSTLRPQGSGVDIGAYEFIE